MQRALNPDLLLALFDDKFDDYKRASSFWIRMTKKFFQDRNLCDCTLNLLTAFANELSRAHRYIHNYICKDMKLGPDEWSITFRDRPFTHLVIEPNPDRSGYINIFEDDKHIQRFEILGRLEHLQAFLDWLWQYGDKRLKSQAAIVARRNVFRKQTKPQLPSHTSRVPSSLKDSTHKHSPDSLLRRPLHHKPFKAQAFKSKGERAPSKLGAGAGADNG